MRRTFVIRLSALLILALAVGAMGVAAQEEGAVQGESAVPGEAAENGAAPDENAGNETASAGFSPLEGMNPANHDPEVRIKDITRVSGVRENQLMGFGLVTGLAGTGDSHRNEFTTKAMSNMMRKFNINVAPEEIRMRNVAAVMVTVDLPSYANEGDRIDVTVSSMSDARSLEGGTLLQTPLEAADGQVYAVAQGAVSVGGFDVEGGRSHITRNHTNVGRIPEGAIVERTVRSRVDRGEAGEEVSLILNEPDFTTASRIAESVNQQFERELARPDEADRVRISVPEPFRDELPLFIAQVEQLPVRPDTSARVVINERTGTVVIGHKVRLSTVAVSHGNLTVRVVEHEDVIHPPPFSPGETEVLTETELELEEEEAQLMVVPSGADVSDIVDGLNAVGATPRDVISILQAIKQAGALHAEIEIM